MLLHVPNQAIGKSRMKVGDNIRKWRMSGVRKMQGVAQRANPTSVSNNEIPTIASPECHKRIRSTEPL